MSRFITIFVLVLALFSGCQTSKNNSIKLVIGTYTSESSEGIYSVDFDTINGTLSHLQLVHQIENPTFQKYDDTNKILWSIGKINGKDYSFSFRFNTDGSFSPIDSIATNESGICHIAYTPKTNIILASNYGAGSVSQVNYSSNFKFKLVKVDRHYGAGIQVDRQEAPHAHSVTFSFDKLHAYACDLGADKIYIYQQQEQWFSKIDSIISTPGNGPRHISFSPDGKYMAVLNELSSSIDLFVQDQHLLYTKKVSTVSTLPDTCQSFTKAADIHYSPNGKFLYASNRGCNSIAVFKQEKNKLQLVEIEMEQCNWIRNFAISPNGKFLIAANRYGNNLTVYSIDQTSGALNCLNKQVGVNQPVCVTFLD